MPPKTIDPETRFWAKVEKTDDCWLWTAADNGGGYGVFWDGKRMTYAHRFSVELHTGSRIPKRLEVDHKTTCSKRCVRPDHLRIVTHKQNHENRDGAQRNSTSGVRGVSWYPAYQKWLVDVWHFGVKHHVGYFLRIEDAEFAAISKRLELFTHNDLDRSFHA